ncbi:zinc transporter ZIP13-like [Branchiostoma floridae]|uniref:Zinc transporter ZIP13 n=1 Tax=Branchiostoma floridae TaxID=7739 RepID=A0A9J7KZJ3_BRAFL|nr:zinc transporter ZIP13-like [Branchiostoma floridae]
METFSARLVFVLLIVATVGCQAEIHRAKAQRPQRAPPESTRQDLSGSGDEAKPENVWLYSFLGSVAVGMCGVFPLLVIPLEAGPALRKGAHAGRLKLMLSFAVGALLGDVFLHLLPEAWVHRGDPGEEKHGHNWVGLWTIAGIMSFLIMEKTFTNTAGEDKADSEETSEDHRHTSHQENGSLPPYQDVSQIRRRSLHDKDSSGDKNGEVFKNGAITSSSPAANGKLKQENGPVNQSENSRNDRDSDNQPSQHIQISGYLNLLANCIDNFTHGLAVGGSFLVSTKVGVLTTLAILLHEIPHEIGDFAILMRAGFSRWRAAKAQIITASGGMFGTATALLAESAEGAGDSTAWILPFTSGGFIYVALVTVVPDLLEETSGWESVKQVAMMIAGITTMGLVSCIA